MLPLLSLVGDKVDRKALMETLSEIANYVALTVKKKLDDIVVSLRAQMQEAGLKDMEKIRFYSPCIKCTGKAVTLCMKWMLE